MKKKFSECIVIGGGRIALSHIPHLIDNPLVNLVGIVERNWLLRFVLRRLFRVKVFSSIESLGSIKFDSAFVLTPPNSHFLIAKKLIKNGKHVFLEKPMTLDPQDSNDLLSLAKKNKLQFSCGYVLRHHPVFQEIKRIINNHQYGAPLNCQISMRGNVVTAASPASWRSSGKGSGCLYDYGCHVIDLSIFLFGKPRNIALLSKEELYQPGVIDKFSAELEYENNFKFSSVIACDWSDKSARKAGLTLNIKTEDHNIFSDGQRIIISGKTYKSYSIKDLDTEVKFYL